MIDPSLRRHLINSCTRLGLPPWETVIRPHLHADAEKVHDLMAQVRNSARAAQGLRPRDRHGRYTTQRGAGGD